MLTYLVFTLCPQTVCCNLNRITLWGMKKSSTHGYIAHSRYVWPLGAVLLVLIDNVMGDEEIVHKVTLRVIHELVSLWYSMCTLA